MKIKIMPCEILNVGVFWNVFLALYVLFRIFPIYCVIFEITSLAKLGKKIYIHDATFWKRIQFHTNLEKVLSWVMGTGETQGLQVWL